MNYSTDRRNVPERRANWPKPTQSSQQRVWIERSQEDRRRNLNERRHHLRYPLNSTFYMRIKKSLRFNIWRENTEYIATIVDISLTGLGARYVAPDIWPYDVNILSVVTEQNSILIRNIAYKVISDRKVFSNPERGQVRKVGIRFVNLSNTQRRPLVALIQRYGMQPRRNDRN